MTNNIISLGGMDSDSDLDGRLEGLIELQKWWGAAGKL